MARSVKHSPLPRTAWLAPLIVGTSLTVAQADDGDVRLQGEPFSYTDVIDSFEEGDAFDLDVHATFRRAVRFATIQRESTGVNARADVADYEQQTNRLVVGIDVGLYRDLGLYVRMPILLSDDRSLTAPGSTGAEEVRPRLEHPDVDPGTGTVVTRPLFDLPYVSPTRSGLEHLALGVAWAIFNQHREPEVPTWVVMAETRIPIGAVLTPAPCATFANTARALSDQGLGNGECPFGDDPGSSPGVWGLRFETRMSRRLAYVEPYAGFAYDLRLAGTAGDRFEPGGSLRGYVHRNPPMEGEVTVGAAFIPWEQRARSQRFAVDVRGTATFVSDGRTYTPLFDALGTSNTFAVQTPVPECGDDSCTRTTAFTGLTDVEAHARLTARLAAELQAARYVRFVLGGSVAYDTAYTLTSAEACNAGVDVASDDPRRLGCSAGVSNPHHRGVLDLPGNRFRLAGQWTLEVFAQFRGRF